MAPEAPGKCRLRRIMDSVTVSGNATGSLCSIEAPALAFRRWSLGFRMQVPGDRVSDQGIVAYRQNQQDVERHHADITGADGRIAGIGRWARTNDRR
jgi:hypothetical protein